eukprot:2759247-Ditylum_brightwellii.AAC.1
MQFNRALHWLLKQIFLANPDLGSVYIAKVDLADAYMQIWICLEDIPLLAFMVLKNHANLELLIGFHLFVPMGYIK